MKKILVIDDHMSVGEGTKMMVDKNFFEVDIAFSGEEGLKKAKQIKYDIYLVDLHMPDQDGLVVTKKIKEIDPNAIIIIYSGYSIEHYFNLLVDAGISGFISKTASREDLNFTLKYALKGMTVIPTSLFKTLRTRSELLTEKEEKQEKLSVQIENPLNERELKVLYYAAKGLTNKQIAHTICLSTRMVEYHLSNAYEKLGVNSRAEAVSKAIDLKFISPSKQK